jgi:hypothetical protein
VQFITTLDPSEVASLLVCGFPGEGPKLPRVYRRIRIFNPLIYCEPRGVLLPISRPEAGASHGDKNVGTLNLYPQFRVDHVLLPRASLRPLFVAGLMQKGLAQPRPLEWRKIDFSTVA